MKPDEHKKKKSAQYKKKHGIDKESQPKDPHQQGRNKTKVERSEAKGRQVKQVPNAQRKLETDSDSTGSEDEHQSTKKSFSRRAVVSNWERYELPPEDSEETEVQQRGEDYFKLLSMSGTGEAQFRFKDEENWEDEESSVQADFMSVDLNSLAERLKCIPLYKRLNVDKDLFSKTQVDNMEEEAKCHCLSYKDSSTDTHVEHDPPSANSLNVRRDNSSDINVEMRKVPSVNKSKHSHDSDLDKHVDALKISEVEDKPNCANSPEIKSKDNTEIQLTMESDLDMILDMDVPSNASNEQSVSQDSKFSVPPISQEQKTDAKENPVKTVTETSELEDWLDSVLDD